MEQITKTIQQIGNGGHIYMPKELVGRKVVIKLVEKTAEDVENDVLQILRPYLKHIKGVYLHGSYARGEQDADSDADVLVITDGNVKLDKNIMGYEIITASVEQLENSLKNNAVLILPILKEAKAIINNGLLEKYRKYQFTKKNTKWYLETTESSLAIAKDLISENDKEGMQNIVYPLMMRLRGLYLIHTVMKNNSYSSKDFQAYLMKQGIAAEKAKQLYRMYRENRDNKAISSHSLAYGDVSKLYHIATNALQEIKGIWGKQT